MKLKSLTNVRPVRDLGVKVVAMPPSNTEVKSGSFKVTEGAASKLGIMKGDYIDIAENPSKPGEFFIGKGFEGIESIDDDGKKSYSGRNGSRVGKSGASYVFAGAAAWTKLGEAAAQVEFTLEEEAVEVDMDHSEEPVPYFKLIKGNVIPKEISAPRGKTEKTEEVADTTEKEDAPIEAINDEGIATEPETSAFDEL